jgi:hypothetical protein
VGFTPTLFRDGNIMFRSPETMFREGKRVGGEGAGDLKSEI